MFLYLHKVIQSELVVVVMVQLYLTVMQDLTLHLEVIQQHLVILLMVADMVVAQDIVVLLMEDVAVEPVMQIT